MPPRITIRDIAEKTGVHFTTVGLALHDSPRVSETTRRKVQAVAKSLGYRPDPMLSALNAYRQIKRRPHFQAAIAWINNWPDRHELMRNADFSEYHQGAVERARELGYEITEFWLHEPGMTFAKLRRILKARNIQGVIMPPQPTFNTEIDFDFAGLSPVALGYSLKSPALHVVTNHHFRSIRLLLTELERQGFHRIGLAVSRDWDKKVGLNWTGGLAASLEAGRRAMEVVRYKNGLLHPRLLLEEMKRHKPDVVISHRHIHDVLRNLKVRFPEDVSFANLSVEYHSRHISGIYQNSAFIGHKAVDQVVDMLHRGEVGVPLMPIHLLIDSIWNPGSTLRPASLTS